MRIRPWWLVLAFALVVWAGYWLATTAMPPATPRVAGSRAAAAGLRQLPPDEPAPRFRQSERVEKPAGDSEAARAGALEGQRVLVFKDQAALQRFLDRMGNGVRLLGRLDALNALRLGFADAADLLGLLDGEEELSYVFPVTVPAPAEGTAQPGAVALHNRLLEWLGITGDNSTWGKGVLIAILDTGVQASSAFNTHISSLNLVALPADLTTQNGHGTAVASMIVGDTALTPGVAPGASILSVRIANDNGEGDSFRLAQGIVAAADAGAQLINISMGSEGDSVLVRNALAYALAKGALIIASAGNYGSNQVSFPAANAGVIAVGAVDALGDFLDFSNSGNAIALSAPGFGVNAALAGDQAASVSGTSFSAPIVSGAIAAVMTAAGTGNLTGYQAYQMILAYANDGGAAGPDPQLGAGMPDLGRVLAGKTPGIYDAALASTRIVAPDAGHPNGQIEILVQNRGTEMLINTAVEVSTGGGVVSINLAALAPNAVQTVSVPISQAAAASPDGLRVDSKVVVANGWVDSKPSNNRRVETYVAAGAK